MENIIPRSIFDEKRADVQLLKLRFVAGSPWKDTAALSAVIVSANRPSINSIQQSTGIDAPMDFYDELMVDNRACWREVKVPNQ